MRINTQKGLAPLVVIIIALLVIGGGGFGIKKMVDKKKERTEAPAAEVGTSIPVPGTETPEMVVENTAAEPTEAIVMYSADGFSPKTITVKKGETVVFQNKTGKPASVASAVHPTHLLYPEFDQYKTAERGKDEFRFTFEKVGTWKYHDHLNPTMTGTVIVE